ncbi:TPA: hypothetical protein DCQ44_00240 [Candidatus Taylorbacteria bacterium]|nr:hypothetical protein [Candidatus Taylorbacteria bacterium]
MMLIAGGLGKNILATAVVASFKEAHEHDNLTVLTAHPTAWQNNPDVKDVLDLNNLSALFPDLIKDKNWTIFKHDPYLTEDFLYRRNHLIDIWCKLLGVTATTRQTRLHITEEEKKRAETFLPEDKKPIFLIQTSGGASNQKYPISWARDLPLATAQKVVDAMNSKGYHTLHIRNINQPALENATWLNATTREIMALLPLSSKRLFIDSFPQHAAAALGLPSVVAWIINSPKMFGYPIHTNIETGANAAFRHYPTSYLDKFDITGAIEQCPFDTTEIFDVETILKALE